MTLRILMLLRLVILLLNLSVFSVATASQQAGAIADSVMLQQLLQQIKTYRASFEQTVTNQYGETLDQASGEFVAQKPQRFRWQSEFQTIVADGESLFSIDNDLEQVEIRDQHEALQSSPISILTNDAGDLSEQFEVVHTGEHDGTHLFQLTPKQAGNAFEQIHILLRGKKIIELLFSDALGQKTVIRFSKIRVNQALSDDVFEVKIPPHFDRIDQRANSNKDVK